MKYPLAFAALFALYLSPPIHIKAQAIKNQTARNSEPASTNVRNAKEPYRLADYPSISGDGKVTFRLDAPGARTVEVVPLMSNSENNGINGLGNKPFPMTRDKDGFWTVTTPPAVPGLHCYQIRIDGSLMLDPSTRTFNVTNRQASCVEVPAPSLDFYLPKDVPHGEVRILSLHSKLTGEWRHVFVYTPPGYDNRPGQRYPVPYLRHGGAEDEAGWFEMGHANFILDNLIAGGKAQPMILVMEAGFAAFPGETHSPLNLDASGARPNPETPEVAKVTVNETIPAIDAEFRTIPDRDHRAIAGFSMGSIQTLYIGLTHLDTFSALGVFSRPPIDNFNPKVLYGGIMTDAAAFNKKIHLFYWASGTEERGIYESIKSTRANLDAAGIRYSYTAYPGLAHEWQVERMELNDFAQKLFRW